MYVAMALTVGAGNPRAASAPAGRVSSSLSPLAALGSKIPGETDFRVASKGNAKQENLPFTSAFRFFS